MSGTFIKEKPGPVQRALTGCPVRCCLPLPARLGTRSKLICQRCWANRQSRALTPGPSIGASLYRHRRCGGPREPARGGETEERGRVKGSPYPYMCWSRLIATQVQQSADLTGHTVCNVCGSSDERAAAWRDRRWGRQRRAEDRGGGDGALAEKFLPCLGGLDGCN
jgi:hypothetical protein